MDMTERTLDWRPHWDPRSNAFRFATVPMCASLRERRVIMRKKSVHLDQGREGACTGFGLAHVLNESPRSQPVNVGLARDLYYEARRQDEWEGESYEGSSVNGVMKAGRLFGYVKSWLWATTVAEARHGLSYHGAGEAGTWWWSGMSDVDDDGFIHPTGTKEGGHAYAVAGYGFLNGSRRLWIENSWGQGWGVNGGAWIWEFDFMALLADGGELAFPSKVRL